MRRQTVLIVDDIASNIDILTNILEDHYYIMAATSGEKALEIAYSDNRPDLILLDVMMPEMDGYMVIQNLKLNPASKDIPVIFVTTKSDVDNEEHGFELGAVDYITKPVNAAITLARVSTHLILSNHTHELEKQVEARTEELKQAKIAIINCLGRAAQFKHDKSGDYVARIRNYMRIFAEAMNISEQWSDNVASVAPMYDIGKIAIEDSILYKVGSLEEEEWREIKRHCEYGAAIMDASEGNYLLSMARDMALYHHERWDGKGYPKGLKGEDIPLVARMMAIVDVFEALTSERSFKNGWVSRPWAIEDAVMKLKQDAGTHFDPNLVKIFCAQLNEINWCRDAYIQAVN